MQQDKKYRSYPAYKASGIEWLGEIPEGWGVLSCKFGYSIQLGKMLQNEPQSSRDVRVPYLKALNVQWEMTDTTNLQEMWASPGDLRKYVIQSGDLLVCEGGEAGRAGILTDTPDICIIQNALHKVKAKRNNSTKYLMYLLEVAGFSKWFDILCNKATITHFTSEKFDNLIIILPTPPEQKAIADFLDQETQKIDKLVQKTKESIDLLKEYRTSLITHAVTGKIDVSRQPS